MAASSNGINELERERERRGRKKEDKEEGAMLEDIE